MTGPAATCLAALLVALVAAPPTLTGATLAPELAGEVRSAIDVGLRHLRVEQRADGSWNGDPRTTSLVLRSLVESHRRYTEEDGPFVRRAYSYLASRDLQVEGLGDGRPEAGAPIVSPALAAAALRHATRPDFQRAAERCRAELEAILRQTGAWDDPPSAGDGTLADALATQALRDLGLAEKPERGALRELALVAGKPATTPRTELLATAWELASGGRLSVANLNLLADALSVLDTTTALPAPSPIPEDWRAVVARRVLARQRADGSWSDENLDPQQGDPRTTTALAILALERLAAS